MGGGVEFGFGEAIASTRGAVCGLGMEARLVEECKP